MSIYSVNRIINTPEQGTCKAKATHVPTDTISVEIVIHYDEMAHQYCNELVSRHYPQRAKRVNVNDALVGLLS